MSELRFVYQMCVSSIQSLQERGVPALWFLGKLRLLSYSFHDRETQEAADGTTVYSCSKL